MNDKVENKGDFDIFTKPRGKRGSPRKGIESTIPKKEKQPLVQNRYQSTSISSNTTLTKEQIEEQEAWLWANSWTEF